MAVAVVILNWNQAADTIRCVRAVAAWQSVRPDVYVVDNGSVDGSADEIARCCPAARLIKSECNRGFAGGTNLGIAAALDDHADPILLLNNDAVIDEQDVQHLAMVLAKDDRLGAVAPLLYDDDGGQRLLSAGGRNIGRHVNTHVALLLNAEAPAVVDYVPGTVALVRAVVFQEAGLFDEDYFFSGEMADLCERAARFGYRSAMDPSARAYHALSRSSELRETLHAYYILRNRFLFVRKFMHVERLPRMVFWSAYGAAAALRAHLTGRRAQARALRLGLIDGLRGRFGGQNERVLATGSRPAVEEIR
ncbi:MAG: glycosyltransferase family 2 protein [Anaerolineales bacterium]|nr:glycosyltransferase family 2 protein [Anaerolineales bacterium]